MTKTADELLSEYRAAEARHKRTSSDDCSLTNLRYQARHGNKRPWVQEALAAFGGIPSEEYIAANQEARRLNQAECHRIAPLVYLALLREDRAFRIIDHSDRLKTKPFEIAMSESLMNAGTWVSAHGSHLRLARYKTREAAEKTIATTTASEIARLS